MIYLSLIFMSFLVYLSLRKGREFEAGFYAISLYFIIFFYVFPLIYYFINGGVEYLGVFYDYDSDVFVFLLASLIVFISGFVFFDLYFLLTRIITDGLSIRFKSRSDLNSMPVSYLYIRPKMRGYQIIFKASSAFFVLLIFFLIYRIYQIGFSDYAETRYALAQSGESYGGAHWKMLLFKAISEALFGALLIVGLNCGYKKTVLFCAVLSLVSLLAMGGGRATLGFSLVFIILVLIPFSLRFSALLLSILTIISFPVIPLMKNLIYMISTGHQWSEVIEGLTWSVDLSGILLNFMHPLMSLLMVDGLLDIIGYRYFYDILQGPLFYLKIIGIPTGDSITYFNTENITGKRISSIPPGYLAFGYVQLGMAGIFVSGILYRSMGVLAKYINGHVNPVGHPAASFLLASGAANTFYHGDFRIIVVSFFLVLGVNLFSKYILFR